MTNLIPASMTKDELLAILKDIAHGFDNDDTLEGSIEFTLGDDPNRWDVRGSYRIGNSVGQGGVRVIGSVPGVFAPE